MPRKTISINPAAKAVLPDGKILDREKILSSLNLDPSTPPDAWLAIVACGSNATALLDKDFKTLVKNDVIKMKHMIEFLRFHD